MDRVNMIHPNKNGVRQIAVDNGNGTYKFHDGTIVTNRDIIDLQLDPKVPS